MIFLPQTSPHEENAPPNGKPRPRHFARNGFFAIVPDNAAGRNGKGRKLNRLFEEIEAGLFHFRGEPSLLWKIPDVVLWTNATNYDRVDHYPENSLIVYHWPDDETFGGDRNASDQNSTFSRNHRRRPWRSGHRDLRFGDRPLPGGKGAARRDSRRRSAAGSSGSAGNTETAAAEVWKHKRFQSYLNGGNRLFHRALCRHFNDVPDGDPVSRSISATPSRRTTGGVPLRKRWPSTRRFGASVIWTLVCAYAGFLVAMAEQGAAQTAGFDLDPRLLDLARENLKDQGLDATVAQCDLTRPDEIRPYRAAFDIVTCNDVIEHVLDPPQAIRNVADMLAPGGLAYFEIPNAFYPGSIVEDLHFRLFGITLLDREEAKEYYLHQAPGVPYTVGHYLELPRFLELLDRAGIAANLLAESFPETGVEAVLEQIETLRKSYHERLLSVPEAVRRRVAEKFELYLAETAKAPRRTPEEQREFVKKYGICVWKVLGRKKRVE